MIEDLIYDIGMNNGDDTAYYLYKGYRVVAVEANPILVERAKERFADEIKNNRLVILNVGISDKSGTAKFYVNDVKDEWSAFDFEIASRGLNVPPREIVVECVRLKEILDKYGVPFYLKTDIEGNDIFVLEDLNKDDLPMYVSVEAHSLQYMCILSVLGYNSFKCIDQTNHNNPKIINNENCLFRTGRSIHNRSFVLANFFISRFPKVKAFIKKKLRAEIVQKADNANWVFMPGCSGPFGEDTFGDWGVLEEVTYNFLHFHFRQKSRGRINIYGWHDIHARLGR